MYVHVAMYNPTLNGVHYIPMYISYFKILWIQNYFGVVSKHLIRNPHMLKDDAEYQWYSDDPMCVTRGSVKLLEVSTQGGCRSRICFISFWIVHVL